MAKKRKLELAGKTDEGKLVFKNVGYASFSLGVPIEVLLEHFKQKDWVVDWSDYIEETIKDGHNPRTVLAKIRAAVGEVYGPKYAEEVLKRAEHYYGQRERPS